MSLHNALIAHGPDTEAFDKGSKEALKPEKLAGTMAFMFETRFVQDPTAYASELSRVDTSYPDVWNSLKRNFKRPEKHS